MSCPPEVENYSSDTEKSKRDFFYCNDIEEMLFIRIQITWYDYLGNQYSLESKPWLLILLRLSFLFQMNTGWIAEIKGYLQIELNPAGSQVAIVAFPRGPH